MESKFSARLAELPGPVWVLGAYVVSRLGSGRSGCSCSSFRARGGWAAARLLMFLIPAAVWRCPSACCGAWSAGAPRVVARPLVCRAACGVAFRCAAHAALFRIRSASVRRYRNVYPGHCPECRICALWFLFLLLSGALPCAGCRDVRGAPQPACGALP